MLRLSVPISATSEVVGDMISLHEVEGHKYMHEVAAHSLFQIADDTARHAHRFTGMQKIPALMKDIVWPPRNGSMHDMIPGANDKLPDVEVGTNPSESNWNG